MEERLNLQRLTSEHAELTSIHPSDMYQLTGSGLTDVDTAGE